MRKVAVFLCGRKETCRNVFALTGRDNLRGGLIAFDFLFECEVSLVCITVANNTPRTPEWVKGEGARMIVAYSVPR